MLVGKTPFHANFDIEVFERIRERKLVIPNELEPEAVDIVDKLLQLDPQMRIGCNSEDFTIDFSEIKAHPFFKGINFESMENTSAPINPPLKNHFDEIKQKMEKKEEKAATKKHLQPSIFSASASSDRPEAEAIAAADLIIE